MSKPRIIRPILATAIFGLCENDSVKVATPWKILLKVSHVIGFSPYQILHIVFIQQQARHIAWLSAWLKVHNQTTIKIQRFKWNTAFMIVEGNRPGIKSYQTTPCIAYHKVKSVFIKLRIASSKHVLHEAPPIFFLLWLTKEHSCQYINLKTCC